MGWQRLKKWLPGFIGVVASLNAFFIGSGDGYNSHRDVEVDHNVNSKLKYDSTCQNPRTQLKETVHMIVSTLDGRVSVLDVNNDGELLWTVQADARPLLSSSIGKLELKRNGVRTRLIPSLDGGLYQYDGESIEAVPMTAEKLLASSFKLDDSTMVVGGKCIKSFGVDAQTGQIRYVCSMEGCKYFGESEVTEDENIIVIRRNTQTVRAVDSKTGSERWNFSVGNHELEFVDANFPLNEVEEDDEDDDVTIKFCPSPGDTEEQSKSNDEIDAALKIVVPEGMVVALDPIDDSHVLWQHKFSSPVTKAWLLKKGQLKPLSIFDDRHVPALSSFQPEGEDMPSEPLLYVGMHQNQLYVQPSKNMNDDNEMAAKNPGRATLPQVAWRPYLNSAPSRTPILQGNRRDQQYPLIGDESDETSLMVWHERYPFDNGYYLYPDVSPALPRRNLSTEDDSIMYIPQSLYHWWKEVIAISLITSVVLHMILTKVVKKDLPAQFSGTGSNENNSNNLARSDSENSEAQLDFKSRFSTEFDFVHCLGKGGFGIVFEAKNKIDECNYAIKRICLSNSNGEKDRVMREVRALAKLDNSGIVRYFNAWIENPPHDWKDTLKGNIEDSECFTPTPCNSGTDLSSLPVRNPILRGRNFGNVNIGLSDSEMGMKCGNSRSFKAHSDDDLTDESGSYSIGAFEKNKPIDFDDQSFHIEFADSESESSKQARTWDDTESQDIPFQNYHKPADYDNSFSVVFEDSGCRDKSNETHTDDRSGLNASSFCDDSSEKDSNDNKSKDLKNVVVEKNSMPRGNLYLYIQMQLCRRETLKDWLCANTLNRDRQTILDIFDQIVEAVDYVHGCGLMHRDLKPSNIFFSIDGAIKIGDFGLVTDLEKQSDEFVQPIETGSVVKHTAEVGTQLYMSPEQIERRVYDHKVDIFSMGMILFELFYPFSTQMERIRTLVDVKKHSFPQRFSKEMPNEEKFVKWLLALKSPERPTTTQILESDLLKDFAVHRASNRFRNRTISGGSSSSKLN